MLLKRKYILSTGRREDKASAVKVEPAEDSRVALRIPYDQRSIKESKGIFGEKMESSRKIPGDPYGEGLTLSL